MSDALERLKNRKRPTVPDRDASLSSNTVQIPPISGTSKPGYPVPPTAAPPPTPPRPPAPLAQPQSIEIKQSTMRLERGLSDRLQRVCREQGLYREVLIEAMFEYCETHPQALQEAIATAQDKQTQRQQAANVKRAKSMMERFSPES